MYAMIDYVGAVQEFPSELLSPWASRVNLHSSNSVLKSLGVAMVVKNQEKEILTSEEIGKLEAMSIIHVEVKCSMDWAARLTAICK